ncbi:TetR/AcrR family transcriptional regulator [Pseudomonas putida]|uniref:TetR/AcrR family transcriptional regulator n=1 Tax=Pseudomonas putida TaxID=303 RepID=UPI003F3D010E
MHRATSSNAVADTQERVRQAALELFTRQGYQSTSLRDLASHLGMQPGSLYNHIENKQALLFDLMEEALDDLLVATRSNIKRGRTREERIRLFVQTSLEFQKHERQRLALINRETVNLSAEQRQHVQQQVDEYSRCLKMVIGGSTSGGSRLDLLSSAIIGMLQGLQLWGHQDAAGASGDDVDQMTKMINGAIGAATA